LQVGGCECVVHHHFYLVVYFFCSLYCLVDVHQFHRWVGWGLNPDYFSVFFNSIGNVFNVSHIDELDLNTIHILAEQPKISLSSSIDIITDNNVITSFECMHNGSSSPTSTGKDYTMFPILNSSNTFLKCSSGRVSTSGVLKGSKRFSNIFLGIS
jgi:hypothetical protein